MTSTGWHDRNTLVPAKNGTTKKQGTNNTNTQERCTSVIALASIWQFDAGNIPISPFFLTNFTFHYFHPFYCYWVHLVHYCLLILISLVFPPDFNSVCGEHMTLTNWQTWNGRKRRCGLAGGRGRVLSSPYSTLCWSCLGSEHTKHQTKQRQSPYRLMYHICNAMEGRCGLHGGWVVLLSPYSTLCWSFFVRGHTKYLTKQRQSSLQVISYLPFTLSSLTLSKLYVSRQNTHWSEAGWGSVVYRLCQPTSVYATASTFGCTIARVLPSSNPLFIPSRLLCIAWWRILYLRPLCIDFTNTL